MKTKLTKQGILTARMVLSFALLGAVVSGVFFGWSDHDIRPYGALAGGSAAFLFKLLHVL